MKDKKIHDLTLKNVLMIIVLIAFLILCLMKQDMIMKWIGIFMGLLTPFILAMIFAFIFHLPLSFFMKKMPLSWNKGRKAIAAGLSLVCILTLVSFVFLIVAPQVINSASMLVENMPRYVDSFISFVESFMEDDMNASMMEGLLSYGEEIEAFVIETMQSAFPKLVSITSGILSGVANFVLAIVIAIYMIVSKDRLLTQCKRVLYAFLNEKQYQYTMDTLRLANTTFSNFISGQLVEAMIIGVLCYVGCVILRIEYAPILAVLIGCTNIIPIFGPIIGTGIGAALLLLIDPLQSIIFVIFGTALQQFESNLIYPRVVGTSVGLSGLWTLMAVSIGGGLFGLPGMIFGLPVFAIMYRLFANEVNRRNALKKGLKVYAVD